MASPFDQLTEIAKEYANEHDTDFAVHLGEMARPRDERLIDMCRSRRRRKNILLMLATRGGDAGVAYRLGRAFQRLYGINESASEGDRPEFIVFIPTFCKSAGTILATAATRIIMSEFAELGPIDVQLRNPLEVGERTSGLTPIQSLDSLKRHSKALFVDHFKQLRFDDSLTFSTKMSADVASEITVGLLSKMYEQVDPIRLAEVERSLKISGDYTERLTKVHDRSNLKDGAVERLLGDYPSHNFIIDVKEARELFKRVDEPDAQLAKAVDEDIRPFVNWVMDFAGPYTDFLSDEPEDIHNAEPDGPGAEAEGEREPEARRADDAEAQPDAAGPRVLGASN